MGLLNNDGPIMSRRTHKDSVELDALDVFMNSNAATQYGKSINDLSENGFEKKDNSVSLNDLASSGENSEDSVIEDTEELMESEVIMESDDSDIDVVKNENIDEETGEILKGLKTDSEIPDDMEFGSNAVAGALGVTTQSIRNYCNIYAKFLNIETTKNGTRRYKMKDIRQLEKIISLKRERGYTTQQMISFLENEGKEELIVTDADRMEAIINNVADAVFNRLTEYIENKGLLEQFTEHEKQLLLQQKELKESKEQIMQQYEQLCRMNSEIDSKIKNLSVKEEGLRVAIESISADIETTQKNNELLKNKEEYIKELEEKIENMQQKKKPFFFRKGK